MKASNEEAGTKTVLKLLRTDPRELSGTVVHGTRLREEEEENKLEL